MLLFLFLSSYSVTVIFLMTGPSRQSQAAEHSFFERVKEKTGIERFVLMPEGTARLGDERDAGRERAGREGAFERLSFLVEASTSSRRS